MPSTCLVNNLVSMKAWLIHGQNQHPSLPKYSNDPKDAESRRPDFNDVQTEYKPNKTFRGQRLLVPGTRQPWRN